MKSPAALCLLLTALGSLPAPSAPTLHPDRSVTFRVKAPNATDVRLTSDLAPKPLAMEKGDNGVWSVTTGPLAPDIYSYKFRVDGTDVLDIENPRFKVWRTSESLIEVPGEPPRSWDWVDAVPHGTVHLHSYVSATLGGTTRPFRVYTPAGYEEKKDAAYPVLYLFHGYGDNEAAWMDVGQAHRIADNLIAAQKAVPMLIVMPYGHALAKGESGDLFGPDRGSNNFDAVSTDTLAELIPYIESHYRVLKDAANRAIVGLSMGGGQALGMGLAHPGTFAWVGGFSSGIADNVNGWQKVFPEVVATPELANEKLKLLWIACGKTDFLLDRNTAFIQWLTEKNIRHTYTLSEGGHSWPVWRRYLSDFLPLLFAPQS